MFRSATFKLTLWYLAIVVVISLIFSGVLYRVGTNDLAFGLHRQTERLSTDFPVFDNSPYLRPGDDLASGSHRLLMRLIAFNVVVFVGAGFASYALARWTLQPIELAHEQQKRFTADASHELRTPLTALKMESEVALLDPKTSRQELQAVLRSNIEETGKLEALINNLLRLTLLEAGELQEHFSSLLSDAVVSEAIEHVKKSATARQISLDGNWSDGLPLWGDAESLVQLLVTLLDNAIKYSPLGAIVTVTTKLAGDQTTITVADHGMGIEPAALEHVFDRFYRADASRTQSDSSGFGLGLSIAKMIADVHRATITISSQSDHGTVAVVSIPNHKK